MNADAAVLQEGREGLESDPIFTPLRFRNLTVKNRIFRSNIAGRFDNEDGSLTQTRINWECRFAKGGVGAIVSSYVPVAMHGRIIANFATIHRDEFIPLWAKLGEAVHSFDCNYIMQLSHSGRQMDLPGISNQHQPTPSSTDDREPLHGFLCRAMGTGEIARLVDAFARAAWRAREAGLDGVELHAANGYLFTQFLSSAINDRTDCYGGSLANRARFLLEVIEAIRAKVGRDFHLQVKLSAIERNNVLPWEGRGNTLEDTIQVARWCEAVGVDAIHVSTGSLFPHPLNPPGPLPLEVLAVTYDAMISSGVSGFRNFLFFRYPLLRPLFLAMWNRMRRGMPIEGVSLDEARAIKAAVSIPVISTGGYQTASFVREAIESGACDAVAIARSLVANPDLPKIWMLGRDQPERPCTYCNKCLTNAPKNPMGCYEEGRYPNREAMLAAITAVYRTKPELRLPRPDEV
ncbi:2,4-dienoyl-CoA reductase (NADPH2) [Skermanella aerolata]|uniref:NADH:flavin oxidoreductase n=1 Tax=Skermanella aerolata TaxID=393310 RepID=UPI003D256B68